MRKFLLFGMIAVICGISLLLAQQESDDMTSEVQDTDDKEVGIWKKSVGKGFFEEFIWTPKDVYLVGEKVPLYIELLCVDENRKTPLRGVLLLNPIAEDLTIYKIGVGELFLWSEEFGPLPVWWRNSRACKGDYIAKFEEIDVSRLHGRPVYPIYNTNWKDWTSNLMPGECHVLKIDDLTRLWRYTAEKCPDVRNDMSFDIRGIYKVQWNCSNVIKFEIR